MRSALLLNGGEEGKKHVRASCGDEFLTRPDIFHLLNKNPKAFHPSDSVRLPLAEFIQPTPQRCDIFTEMWIKSIPVSFSFPARLGQRRPLRLAPRYRRD